MPLSEIANAICFTYIATEYHLATHDSPRSVSTQRHGGRPLSTHGAISFLRSFFKSRSHRILIGIVSILNLLERYSQEMIHFTSILKTCLEQMFHIPKIVLVASFFTTSLYYDCLTSGMADLSVSKFLREVGWQFVCILPLYPFLAVLIAFFFGFMIEVFEQLHLPLNRLNAPIYYGVLYGPFATIYFRVKMKLIEQQFGFTILPMTTTRASTMAVKGDHNSYNLYKGNANKVDAKTGSVCPRFGISQNQAVEPINPEDYFQPDVKPLPSDFFRKIRNAP